MELKLLWQLIVRRKFLMIQAFVVIVAMAAFISARIPDTYISTGKIYDNTNQDTVGSLMSSIGLEELSGMMPNAGSTLLKDDIEQIQMRPYVQELIHKLFLMDGEYRYRDPTKLVNPGLKDRFKGNPYVQVTMVPESSIIEITASSTYPREAMQMVNTLADIFIRHTLEKSKSQYSAARHFVDQQLESVSDQYDQSLNAQRVFQEQYGGLDMAKEIDVMIDRMAQITTELEDNNLELHEADAALKKITAQLEKADMLVVTSREILNNQLIQSLKQRISDLNLLHAQKSVEFRESHPELQSIKKQIDAARLQLQDQYARVFGSETLTMNPTYRQLQDLYVEKMVTQSILQIRNSVIPKIIEKYEQELQKLPHLLQQYSRLELSLKINEQLYQSLLAYRQSIGVAESMALSRLELVEPGFLPDTDRPSSPNRALILMMAVFVGVVFGFCLALLVDYFDDTIKNMEDVEAFQNLHVIGYVPDIKKKKLYGQPTVIALKPDSPIYETYRSIRNNIKFSLDERKENAFLVTSVGENEGKTTTVCNLGLLFAKAGIRPLVLDLDLRKPKVHEMFQLPNQKGVSTVLLKGAASSEVVQRIDFNDSALDVMTSGPLPVDAGLLTESEMLNTLLDYLKAAYDVVLVDTPPVLSVSDALVLGKRIKNVVWVLDLKTTHVHAAQGTRNLMDEAGIKILGVIINKKQYDIGKYYYQRYYYDKSYA